MAVLTDIERLGALRMRPFAPCSDLAEIPCEETSDPDRLCPHPLVSVQIITYNQESSIRAAIEGVMMQRTDFPFELLIGEDASTDATRAICLEFQRSHPECIRVLWSERNVGVGANAGRLSARSRGEYWAFCEGDDVWTDPLKLQKQVDMMRAHPEAGLCLAGTKVEDVRTGRITEFPYAGKCSRVVSGEQLVRSYLDDADIGDIAYRPFCFQTSGYLVRKRELDRAVERFPEAYRYVWSFGDIILATTVAAVSQVCFLLEPVSRYRVTGTGISSVLGVKLVYEGILFSLYLRSRFDGIPLDAAIRADVARLRRHLGRVLSAESPEAQRAFVASLDPSSDIAGLFDCLGYRGTLRLLARGRLTSKRWRRIYRTGRLLHALLPLRRLFR